MGTGRKGFIRRDGTPRMEAVIGAQDAHGVYPSSVG